MVDKIDNITVLADGTVRHNVLKQSNLTNKQAKVEGEEAVKTNQPRTWKSLAAFRAWRSRVFSDRQKYLSEKLTPLQFFVTQGKGWERPFTGDFWWTKDVGIYSCAVCTQRLFMSEHKFPSKSGYPTFWHNIRDSLEYKVDKIEPPLYSNAHEDPLLKNKIPERRCLCSNCESHLGYLYSDGPLPFRQRIQVNSAAIDFIPKPWFKPPDLTKEEVDKMRNEKKKVIQGQIPYQTLVAEEQKFNFPSFDERLRQRPPKRRTMAERRARNFRKLERKEEAAKQAPVFDIKGVKQ